MTWTNTHFKEAHTQITDYRKLMQNRRMLKFLCWFIVHLQTINALHVGDVHVYGRIPDCRSSPVPRLWNGPWCWENKMENKMHM